MLRAPHHCNSAKTTCGRRRYCSWVVLVPVRGASRKGLRVMATTKIRACQASMRLQVAMQTAVTYLDRPRPLTKTKRMEACNMEVANTVEDFAGGKVHAPEYLSLGGCSFRRALAVSISQGCLTQTHLEVFESCSQWLAVCAFCSTVSLLLYSLFCTLGLGVPGLCSALSVTLTWS
eukprot:496005-Amphidinium_carterae.1